MDIKCCRVVWMLVHVSAPVIEPQIHCIKTKNYLRFSRWICGPNDRQSSVVKRMCSKFLLDRLNGVSPVHVNGKSSCCYSLKVTRLVVSSSMFV